MKEKNFDRCYKELLELAISYHKDRITIKLADDIIKPYLKDLTISEKYELINYVNSQFKKNYSGAYKLYEKSEIDNHYYIEYVG